jgi:hypothetical protein
MPSCSKPLFLIILRVDLDEILPLFGGTSSSGKIACSGQTAAHAPQFIHVLGSI